MGCRKGLGPRTDPYTVPPTPTLVFEPLTRVTTETVVNRHTGVRVRSRTWGQTSRRFHSHCIVNGRREVPPTSGILFIYTFPILLTFRFKFSYSKSNTNKDTGPQGRRPVQNLPCLCVTRHTTLKRVDRESWVVPLSFFSRTPVPPYLRDTEDRKISRPRRPRDSRVLRFPSCLIGTLPGDTPRRSIPPRRVVT